MVPPEEIDPNAPTTLPADFGEWDSGEAAAHAAAVPVPEVVPVPVAPSRPPAKAATARVAVLPAASRAPSPPPRPPAPAYAEVEPVYQAPQPHRARTADARPKFESPEPEKSKTGTYAAIGVLVLLLAGGGGWAVMRTRSKPVPANQSVQTQTAMTDSQKPALTPSTAANPGTAATANTPASNTQTAVTPQPDRVLSPQALAINQQAAAPSRIARDLAVVGGREAPPSADFGPVGAESPGTGSNPFSGQSGPKVRVAPQKVTLSSGVAVGLLVSRNTPVYPPIAKAAHVSGTVVIQATISKSGTIGNLRAVSGPVMLRQSALDSVKTWRFRPYMLDGEPVEVDTTVNVTYAPAQ
jgi:protein TonB